MTEFARGSSKGLLLQPPDGVDFHFDPGSLCLELLVTGGPGPLARFEVLHRPAGLTGWAESSRLDPTPHLEVTELELAAARLLRDSVLTLARDRLRGREPRPEDLAEVNAAAARPPLAPVLEWPEPGGLEWLPATGTQLLSTVARDAIDLFTGPYAHRIRECGADDCSLIFVDTSRPGRRRWCSMERCGNRHKVRALRARQGGAGTDEEAGGPLPGTGGGDATARAEAVDTGVPAADAGFGDAGSPRGAGSAGSSEDAGDSPEFGGRLPTGLTRDAGWEIGVSKTLGHPPGAVWDFITGPEGLSCWLGDGVDLHDGAKGRAYETDDGTVGEVRSYRPGDRIRLTWRPSGWDHDTTVQVAVTASRGSEERSVLRFHQEWLAGPEERERQRTHWRAVMDSVVASLDA
ncbi:hypothetical protein D7M15_17725 [Streptomyces sp. Z26]|nr:hypothetical protein D7M15_17725 [Streptomyces sp. Z26]